MEHIIAAAIKYDNRIWQLPRPKRHHDVMRNIGGMFDPVVMACLIIFAAVARIILAGINGK